MSIGPDYDRAHINLGNALKDQGQLDDAMAAYRQAMNLKPDDARYHGNLIVAMLYHPGYDQRAIGEECRRWYERYAEPYARSIARHSNSPDPDRRVRIGYVSPEFRSHVDGWLMAPLLANHDHRDFEIFCYAGVARPDSLTEELRGHTDVWRNTVGLSDQQVADLVRDDRIDILVDLKLHTGGNRLLVFARKPAPVQVCWLRLSRDHRPADDRLPPDRSLPRSAGSLRRVLCGEIRTPTRHFLVLPAPARRSAGQSAPRPPDGLDHLRLPEQLLQGQ